MRKVVFFVFVALVATSPLHAQQPDAPTSPPSYELSASYSAAFVTDGDQTGKAFELSASRKMFSNWTGLTLSLSYQRVVNKGLREAVLDFGSFADKHTYTADLVLFAEPLRFSTGTVGHRFRLGAGPSVQKRHGEANKTAIYPIRFKNDPGAVEELRDIIARNDEAHLYLFHLEGSDLQQNGQYALITRDWEGTEWGGLFRLSYGAEFKNFVAGLNVSGRLYQHQYKVWSTGFSFGYQF